MFRRGLDLYVIEIFLSVHAIHLSTFQALDLPIYVKVERADNKEGG